MSGAVAAEEEFRYENCADQGFGLALEKCATISVSSTLDMVYIRDEREASNGSGLASGDYYFLEAPSIPLAVPSKGYGTVEQWEFGGHLFVKIAKGNRYFVDRGVLDVIAVVPKPSGDIRKYSREQVYRNAILSFWYSPSAGVAAIAFRSKAQNGETYFCAGEKCLFGSLASAP